MEGIIIGGGIGGLTAALALQQQGIGIQLYEGAPELRPVGAGIWMAPNAMQVFDRLGIADDIMQGGIPLKAVQLADQDLRILGHYSMEKPLRTFGYAITAIHRGQLQQSLLAQIEPDRIHLGCRFQSFQTKGERIEVRFEDGATATGDFLIGADGLRSAVRGQLFPDSNLRYSGQTCWRGVGSLELEPRYRKTTIEVWGDRGRFGFSEIAPGQVYWWADRPEPQGERDTLPGLQQRLLELYRDFASPVPDIMKATPEESLLRNDLCDLEPMPRWYEHNVCLIGDAAHATTPNLGQGGGQAVEDALALALCLGRNQDVQAAFAQFQALRMPKAHYVVNTSWRFGQLVHLPAAWQRRLRDWLVRLTPAAVMESSFDRLYRLNF